MSPHDTSDQTMSVDEAGGKAITEDKTVTKDKSITDDKEWVNGDCVVITSDNVRFRVPSYHLRAASHVFSAIFDLPHSTDSPSAEIILDNEEFETAKVFDAFLHLIVSGQLDMDHFLCPSNLALPKFLDKWDCRTALNHYLAVVRAEIVTERGSCLTGFIIGATLDSPDLCFQALRDTVHEMWGEMKEKASMDHGTQNESTLDPAHWPLYMWTSVPSEYAAALARAFGECQDNRKPLADAFLKYLKLAKAKK